MAEDNFLEEKQNEPLLRDVGLTKYQHVERLGHENVEGLLDGTVTVQTKIDGANLTVAWYPGDRGLVIASRNHPIHHSGTTVNDFAGAVTHILSNQGIQSFLADHDNLILRGEWMVKHTLTYRADVYGQFIVFDVQKKEGDMVGRYLPFDEYAPLLTKYGIPFIPVLATLDHPTVEQLTELTKGPDEFGAPEKEGVVIKRYDYVNKFGRQTWAKIVTADFKEKSTLAFKGGKAETPEVRFAANVTTRAFILKTIEKVAEARGRKSEVRDMPEVLGRVWHDAFTEEMWDFVRENHVKTFDFREARHLVEQKTRDIALAYYNGIPMIEIGARAPAAAGKISDSDVKES